MNKSNLSKSREDVYYLLSNGLTQMETSKRLGVSRAGVSQITKWLITNNFLKKNSEGHYKIKYFPLIPPDGKSGNNFIYTPNPNKRYSKSCKSCGKRFLSANKNQTYCSHLCAGERHRGPNNPRYTGHTYFPYCWMYNAPMKERVKAFFDYRCVMCGKDERENFDRKGRQHKLAVHHVKYNPKACCKGHDKPKDKQFVPLCLACHNKTSRTKDRKMWLRYFSRLIEEVYGGKCYFTKEEFAPQDLFYKF